jgi:uncharacterized membrane protein
MELIFSMDTPADKHITQQKKSYYWSDTVFFAGGMAAFFPNALYIITDLIHLEDLKTEVPVWFDAILLFTSSVTGLIMAFASLFKAEAFLQTKIRDKIVNWLIIGCLFAGSFGVYLGRFLRWNSWDIITDPFSLLTQATAPLISPIQHYRTWVVTGLLTCLFTLLYVSIKKLPGLLKEPGSTPLY